jgi:hypothetical protein
MPTIEAGRSQLTRLQRREKHRRSTFRGFTRPAFAASPTSSGSYDPRSGSYDPRNQRAACSHPAFVSSRKASQEFIVAVRAATVLGRTPSLPLTNCGYVASGNKFLTFSTMTTCSPIVAHIIRSRFVGYRLRQATPALRRPHLRTAHSAPASLEGGLNTGFAGPRWQSWPPIAPWITRCTSIAVVAATRRQTSGLTLSSSTRSIQHALL